MAVNQGQITPGNGVGFKDESHRFAPTASMTNAIALMRQLRTRVKFLSASIYARTYTAALALGVGYVPVGRTLADVTLVIGTTKSKFQLSVANLGISGTLDANTGLATIVNKAIQDEIAFSAAYTINVAAATGQFWGAFRIQMDSAGVITTRASAQNQAFTLEADAVSNCPAAATNMIDLGTITIRCATGVAFTCQTTLLDAAGTTVHYNGKASGFTLITTGTMAPVAATLVQGTLAGDVTATTPSKGCLLVARYTSDASVATADCSFNFGYRPYPMNEES